MRNLRNTLVLLACFALPVNLVAQEPSQAASGGRRKSGTYLKIGLAYWQGDIFSRSSLTRWDVDLFGAEYDLTTDRALFLGLEPIPEECRRPEQELWSAFENERPQILGVLLDALVHGLRRLPQTRLERHPRMADFALWATACETALWSAGTFSAAYSGNRDEAVDSVIEADPVASTVRVWMATRGKWTGTASELLGALSDNAGETLRKAKTWPATPRSLSGRLRRAATFLRAVGIDIDFAKKGRKRTRMITISTSPDTAGTGPSTPSASPAAPARSVMSRDFGCVAKPTARTGADAGAVPSEAASGQTVRAHTLQLASADDTDGADANLPPHSAGWRTRL